MAIAGLLAAGVEGPVQPGDAPPFSLPFRQPAGPGTWLLGQGYGNTQFAFRNRDVLYAEGQGIHFGLDFEAPCGTEVLAIGDGVVGSVDDPARGAGPHSLMLHHLASGYASFYGHLLERPALEVGQEVRQGQPVGKTGDPDKTCTSNPHLHLELRDLTYKRAYNPVTLIAADWVTLALVQADPGFEQELEHPRRWQRLADQPEARLCSPPRDVCAPLLNDFARPWPPAWK